MRKVCAARITCLLFFYTLFSTQPSAKQYAPVGFSKGRLILEDDFNRTERGEAWSVISRYSSFTVKEGILVGAQIPDTHHGAVTRIQLPFKDAVIQFDFRFDGSPSWNFVVDDMNCREVHAGHICRLQISPKRIKVQDDKTGVMNLKYFDIRKDPKHQMRLKPLFDAKINSADLNLDPNVWYRMKVVILGDHMEAYIDNQFVVGWQSEGFNHPSKTQFGFTVMDRYMHYDNLKVWEAHAVF